MLTRKNNMNFKSQEKEEYFDYSTVIAWANNQEIVYYETFGSYQGEWVLITRDEDDTFYIYKGYYGSCSGCDSLQATDISSLEEAKSFSSDYPSFIEIPKEQIIDLISHGNFKEAFPANFRDEYSEFSLEEVIEQSADSIKNLLNL